MPEKETAALKVACYTFIEHPGSGMQRFIATGGNLEKPIDIHMSFFSSCSLEKSAEEILGEALQAGELDHVVREAAKGNWIIPPTKEKKPPETVSLIIRREDEEDKDLFFEFEVRKSFLIEYLQGENIEDFLSDYTSEDSQGVYARALLKGAILRESGCLETGRDPDDFPYRYRRIINRAQLKLALTKGSLVKFVRHHWRKRLDLYSEVTEVHSSHVMTKSYGNPQLLLSQGEGLKLEIEKASYYEFKDTVLWFDRPSGDPERKLIAEFYVLARI